MNYVFVLSAVGDVPDADAFIGFLESFGQWWSAFRATRKGDVKDMYEKVLGVGFGQPSELLEPPLGRILLKRLDLQQINM